MPIVVTETMMRLWYAGFVRFTTMNQCFVGDKRSAQEGNVINNTSRESEV